MKTDIKGIINMELDITRCTMQHNLCGQFSKLKMEDICGKFWNNKVLGDHFVSAITPKLECPFKKGIYETKSVVMDLEFAAQLPFAGWL